MLLTWARQQCENYSDIYIDDFTHSWRDGRAFLVILHRHKLVSVYSTRNIHNFCEILVQHC